MKVATFIDGGYLRILVKQAGFRYTPEYIEQIAHACLVPEESLLRTLYYDCRPYTGSLTLPVSGQSKRYRPDTRWLEVLAAKPQFAVRLGTLKFRGFRLKKERIATAQLQDDDFRPRFEQKGVDMRLGLDIAHYANNRAVDRIILISGDTDCLPAMKVARMAGLQVVLIQFPKARLAGELLAHSDFCRATSWP